MPTLEDTIEFQASTLNDLLEAEAKSVAAPSAGEGKYRSWAFLATAAAGLLAIILVVSLVTHSGGKSSGSGSAKGVDAKAYPGLARRALKVSNVTSDIMLNSAVDVYKGSTLVVSEAKVTKIDRAKDAILGSSTVELALTRDQLGKINAAFPGNEKASISVSVPGAQSTPATSAPAATPDTTPTAPTSTPPSSG